MREAPGSSPQRAGGLFPAAALALLLVLLVGANRGGVLALLLLPLLPLCVPGPRPGRARRWDHFLRWGFAIVLLVGIVAVLLLRSPAALAAAILLLWIVPLLAGGLLGVREEEDPR